MPSPCVKSNRIRIFNVAKITDVHGSIVSIWMVTAKCLEMIVVDTWAKVGQRQVAANMQAKLQTWLLSPPVGCYRPNIRPSPLVDTHFTVPRRVEGWVDLGITVSVQPVPKAAYRSDFRENTNCTTIGCNCNTACGCGVVCRSILWRGQTAACFQAHISSSTLPKDQNTMRPRSGTCRPSPSCMLHFATVFGHQKTSTFIVRLVCTASNVNSRPLLFCQTFNCVF